MADREPGRLVGGRYRLRQRIGRGGAGEVWRATDDVLDREVALKILHRHLIGDEAAMDRFRREAVTAAGINHANIVVIHDIGEDDEDVFLVMELIDGPTLGDIVQRTAPLAADAVVAIGHQVAVGLGAAHRNGLVHRDVKPANVLLTASGTAKVADFGIAKALGGVQATLTQPGEVLGTASYLAPEQLSGEDVDPRADVYALGLVLYEALTAQRAFGGETVTEVAVARFSEDEVRPSNVRSGVPDDLDDLVARATRQDPADRFDDGGAMAGALAGLRVSGDRDAVIDLVAPHRSGADGSVGTSTQVLRPESPAGADASATTRAAPRRSAAERTDGRRSTSDRSSGTRDGESPSWRRLAYVVPAVVLVTLAVVLVVQALNGDGGSPGGGAPEPLEITGATDLDPLGNDGREHPEDVPLAHDGDPGTAWRTSRYNSADLGGLKDGVGIAFELAGDRSVGEVRIDVATPGISYQVYALEEAPSGDPSGWGEPVATVDGAGGSESIDAGGSQARHWVIWITRLADGGGRAEIAEVTFAAG